MKNIGRYLTFGFRQDWLEIFFHTGISVLTESSLGPKQKDALNYYLQDAELIYKKQLTLFYNAIKPVYDKDGINSDFIWSIIWINLSFNSFLFTWWNTIPEGKYTRDKVIEILAGAYGKENRTLCNAQCSLRDTFEKSPIGYALKQGIVKQSGRARSITKEGHFDYNSLTVLYCLYKFAEKYNEYTINLNFIREKDFSPQKVLTISTDELKNNIRSLWKPQFLTIDGNNGDMIVKLNREKKALDVVGLYNNASL